MRSPWVAGAADERSQRALAELDLRRSRELDVTLSDLEYRANSCPLFQNVIRRVRYVSREKPGHGDFAAWSEFFSNILAAAGWPGEADLTSEEQHVVEAWKDKLSTLASLTLVSGRASYDDALARLRSLLNESGPAAGDLFSPIQILDISQASGLGFDQAFVAGVSEENTFFQEITSPLIPLNMQRACGVPGASATSLYKYREQAVTDLLGVATRIWVTYSGRLLPMPPETSCQTA